MGTNLVQMSSVSLEAITLSSSVEAMDALATFKKQNFPNEKASFEIFLKISKDSLRRDVGVEAVKILQNLKLDYYPAELDKRNLLRDLARDCKREEVATAAFDSLLEESEKKYKLEDRNFFEEIALQSQFPKIAIASVNRLKEIHKNVEKDITFSFVEFWNIHKNSKWIIASQVAFLFLIENNFFTSERFKDWTAYRSYFDKYDKKN